MKNKKELAKYLSLLQPFIKPKVQFEQYQTDAELAAEALWTANLHGDIDGKTIADLGCGTGIFGLGALLLGAKLVHFIDMDDEAIATARANHKEMENEMGQELPARFHCIDILSFNTKVDVVIQNPPFGVQKSHTDKKFLQKAMDISDTIYSFHKIESKNFINRFAGENGFMVDKIISLPFPLRKTLFFHCKKTYYVDVGFWRIQRKP